jgi:predicted nucleotidyltransferase
MHRRFHQKVDDRNRGDIQMAEINALAVELAKKFITYLQNQGIKIDSAYLFGSFAKGTEHKWSDIDVAVISSDFSDDRFEEGVRLMILSHDIDNRIEPVPFNPETFIDEDPLAWEIKKTGYLLV